MNTKKWILTAAVLFSTNLMTLQAQAMYIDPLKDICLYLSGYGNNLTQEVRKDLARNKPTSLNEAQCLGSKTALRSGRIRVYRIEETRQYLIVHLNLRKKIATARFTEPNFPEVRIEENFVTMNDGIKLPTLVFHPTHTSPHEVTVLYRTPYLHTNSKPVIGALEWVAKTGSRYIVQPARGTFTAPGQFEWLDWKQEREDARSTLDWIANQQWNGKQIVSLGVSYGGFLSLAAAATYHPNLIATVALSSPWNPQTDSLSEGGRYWAAAEYLYDLNTMTTTGKFNAKAITKLAKENKDPADFKKKLAMLGGFDFKSLPIDFKFTDNKDLVEALKKVKIPVLHGFGFSEDRDSREVVNLSKELKGYRSHFFFGHKYGHSITPGLDLLEDLLKRKATNDLGIRLLLRDRFMTNTCFLNEIDSDAICGQDFDNILPTKNLTLRINKPERLVDDPYRVEAPQYGSVLGTSKIKVNLSAPQLSEPVWIQVSLYYCKDRKCNKTITPTVPHYFKLKPGTHTYEINSQHQYFRIAAGDTMAVLFNQTTYDGKNTWKHLMMNFLEINTPVLVEE